MYRDLGNTGLKVSEVGFGTWGLGGDSYGTINDTDSIAALNVAYEKGCNFFDTSDLYGQGHSETILQRALGQHRKNIVIGTKFGMLPHTGFDMKQDFSNEHIENALHSSLERLNTDYVDIYLFHSPSRSQIEDSGSALTLLTNLEKQGKIKAIGVSVRSPEDALWVIENTGIQIVELNFNLIDQRAIELDVFKKAGEKCVGIIARTPLSFGYLSGKLSGDEVFPQNDHRSNWPLKQRELWAKAPKLFDILNKGKQRTLTQLALLFCIADPAVSTVIPGMLSSTEVIENMETSILDKLSLAELVEIRNIYKENKFYDPTAKNVASDLNNSN